MTFVAGNVDDGINLETDGVIRSFTYTDGSFTYTPDVGFTGKKTGQNDFIDLPRGNR